MTGNTFSKRLKDGLFGHLLACLVELYVCWEHVSIIHPQKKSEQIYICVSYINLCLQFMDRISHDFTVLSFLDVSFHLHLRITGLHQPRERPLVPSVAQATAPALVGIKKTQVKEGPSKKYGWTMFEHVWPFTKTTLFIYRLWSQEYNSIRRWQDILICFYGPARSCASPNSLNEQHRKTHILSVTMWAGGVSKTHRPEALLHHLVFFLLLLWLWCWTDLRWLVVEPHPSEKWWSESQLGWWNSQLNGKLPEGISY